MGERRWNGGKDGKKKEEMDGEMEVAGEER